MKAAGCPVKEEPGPKHTARRCFFLQLYPEDIMEMSYRYDRRSHKLRATMRKGFKTYEVAARHLGELKRRVSSLVGAGWRVEAAR
jgi:hypothetical protein